MNESGKKIASIIYLLVTAVIAGVAVIFQNILVKHYYESGTGLYKAGTVAPQAFFVYLVISVLVMVAFAVALSEENCSNEMGGSSFLTGIISFCSAVVIIYSGISFFMAEREVFIPGSTEQIIYYFKLLGSVVAIFAGLYYFMAAFSGKTKSKLLPGFSFFPMIWTWFYLLSMYFDHSLRMNSPLRVLQQVALISLLLYQLLEIRVYLGKGKPFFMTLLTGTTVVLLSPSFIPQLFECINNKEKLSTDMLNYIYFGLMVFYVIFRMADTILLSENSDKPGKQKRHQKGGIFDEDDEEEELAEENDSFVIDNNIQKDGESVIESVENIDLNEQYAEKNETQSNAEEYEQIRFYDNEESEEEITEDKTE